MMITIYNKLKGHSMKNHPACTITCLTVLFLHHFRALGTSAMQEISTWSSQGWKTPNKCYCDSICVLIWRQNQISVQPYLYLYFVRHYHGYMSVMCGNRNKLRYSDVWSFFLIIHQRKTSKSAFWINFKGLERRVGSVAATAHAGSYCTCVCAPGSSPSFII